MFIDSHAHLCDLDDLALQAVLMAASEAGVERILNTAAGPDCFSQLHHQYTQHPALLLSAAGYTPFDVPNLPKDWIQRLDSALGQPETVACGETGLDGSNPSYPPLHQQQSLLEKHFELAHKHNLPMVLHSRGAEMEVLKLCKEAGHPKVLFHCFTGTVAEAEAILESDYYLSYSGIVTFKNQPLTDQIKHTPLKRLLIESDSPYLAPVPHRGKPNQPAWISLTAQRIAQIKDITLEELALSVRANFECLFCPPTPA